MPLKHFHIPLDSCREHWKAPIRSKRGSESKRRMATKISFFNLKGGVGKTSLLVNVASCLAYLGKKVLVVDFDAQSNSSIWLMRLDRWNALNRDPSNFILSLFTETGSSLRSCIQKDVVRDADGEIALKGQDLARASFNLMDFEHDLPNPWEKPFYAHYYEELQSVEKDYDYIFRLPAQFLPRTKNVRIQ